jgi:hypothetical protein
VAYRQAHASGASNVGEVVAEMTADKITVDEDTVRHVLREFSEVQFVEVDWFFHRPPNPERDRLRNVNTQDAVGRIADRARGHSRRAAPGIPV